MLKLKSDSIRASELSEWCMANPDEAAWEIIILKDTLSELSKASADILPAVYELCKQDPTRKCPPGSLIGKLEKALTLNCGCPLASPKTTIDEMIDREFNEIERHKS